MSRLDRLAELTESLRIESLDASLFARFFYHAPLLCCIADERGHFSHVNFLWEKVFGYTDIELCSRPWLHFVHPEDIEKTISIAESMGSSPVLGFTNRYRKKDGTYQKVKWITTVFKDGKSYAIAEPI